MTISGRPTMQRSLATGQYVSRFSVSIEDGYIVFAFANEGNDGLADIDGGDVAQRLLSLVQDRHGSRFAGLLLAPSAAALESHGDDQYAFVDESLNDLLRLAADIGPLFGEHGASVGGAEANAIRESIASWKAAAATLAVAQKLRSVLDCGDDPHILDDELIFSNVTYEQTRFYRITYLNDAAFRDAYLSMLTVGEEEYASTFPETSGGSHISRGGFDGSGLAFFRLDRIPGDFVAVDAAGRSALQANGDAEARDGFVLLDEQGRAVADLIEGSARIYAWRAVGEVSLLGLDPSEVPFRDASLPDGSVLSLALSNEVAAAFAGVRERLYEALYDNLVLLHTHRTSYDLRRMGLAEPMYTNALEHIWVSFATSSLKHRVSFCPNCGRPFEPRRGREWCSDYCREDAKVKMRRGRERAVRLALTSLWGEGGFTIKRVVDAIGIPSYGPTVNRVVGDLVKQGRLRSLGGRGDGRRYEVTPLGELEGPYRNSITPPRRPLP